VRGPPGERSSRVSDGLFQFGDKDPRLTNPDPEVRKTAEYFRQRAADIAAIMRAAEETRSHLSIHIDRLLPIKDRLRFSRSPAELQENINGGQVYLDDLRTLAAGTQRVADNLDNFWGASRKSLELYK
jgi:hypothetical protein